MNNKKLIYKKYKLTYFIMFHYYYLKYLIPKHFIFNYLINHFLNIPKMNRIAQMILLYFFQYRNFIKIY